MYPHEMAAGVREGEVLAGKYRIEKVLAAGGMGVVVAAHHLALDQKVALKFPLPDALANQEAVARFVREARAAVRINSEHVAKVSDVSTLENGAPYMVMEYLDGEDLGTWLERRGPLPVEQAVDFVLQACEALAEAHALGIVHRDLKPANLFVIRRADGVLSIKVLDFGISKTIEIGTPDMTRTASVMGSPSYMSPEQMHSSKGVDHRTDLWSLGVMLQELLTGQPPFAAEAMPGLVLQIASAPPAPMRISGGKVPLGLEEAVHRCLEKDREARYSTVAELAEALVRFGSPRATGSLDRIRGVMQGAGSVRSGLERADPVSNAPSGRAPPTLGSWCITRAVSRRRSVSVGAAAVALVLCCGVAWYSVMPTVEPVAVSESTRAHDAAGGAEPELSPELVSAPTLPLAKEAEADQARALASSVLERAPGSTRSKPGVRASKHRGVSRAESLRPTPMPSPTSARLAPNLDSLIDDRK